MFKKGDRVTHPEAGIGTVIDARNEHNVRVEFDNGSFGLFCQCPECAEEGYYDPLELIKKKYKGVPIMQAELDNSGTLILVAETDFEDSYLRRLDLIEFRAHCRMGYANNFTGVMLINQTAIKEIVKNS